MNGHFLDTRTLEQLAGQANFNPRDLAACCGMSTRQMQRHFKKIYQQTPSQWLRELQCRIAKELISKGYSSKATAFDTGFGSDSHFCREFKKIFGVAPQTFSPAHKSVIVANRQ